MTDVYDRTVITGGSGMLAQAIVRTLQSRRHQAHVLDRGGLDITNAQAVLQMMHERQPTLIINCAAYTKVDLCETNFKLAQKVNRDGAMALARAAAETQAQLVHFSTDFVFNGRSNRPYLPGDPTDPLSAYGVSKLQGEMAIRELLGDQAMIVRTAWLYGPGGPSFPKAMLDAARAGKPLRVVNDQVGSPTFTHDLAAATLDLVERNARGIVHVTNSGQTTWFDFAKAIFEEFGLSPDLQPISSADWKAMKPQSAHRPAYSVLDLSDFERITGRAMRSWREALHDFHVATLNA